MTNKMKMLSELSRFKIEFLIFTLDISGWELHL